MIITVRHNIEVAHRLFNLKGRCEQIHGHSMHVELSLIASYNEKVGAAQNLSGRILEFGAVKREFRKYLDTVYDHRLLLNAEDPWAQPIDVGTKGRVYQESLPGLQAVKGDPTTENIARGIVEWATKQFETDAEVLLHETDVNAAKVFAYWNAAEKVSIFNGGYGR